MIHSFSGRRMIRLHMRTTHRLTLTSTPSLMDKPTRTSRSWMTPVWERSRAPQLCIHMIHLRQPLSETMLPIHQAIRYRRVR
ncbi:hypothetical protein A1O1_05646 [Capronia coronata CBS 617.96]|uniref:Uncharacterized protein n=1 Tax=Capronia coronata CBS 617.96 TaxID=1182541 RepID=W9Z2H3_9EURO|nr:uncharacterized protein A1O1_05646 [Capronia coronata CBS 617.96]EXJ88714.1 hypothetical protein A1O1_05646 [Capronia coronata CBS 617.96]